MNAGNEVLCAGCAAVKCAWRLGYRESWPVLLGRGGKGGFIEEIIQLSLES